MGWIYKIGQAAVKICDNREVIHWSGNFFHDLDYFTTAEKENEMRRELCPHVVHLSEQEEVSDVYFAFIEQETTGLWYRTGGIIFHFEEELDATAFKLRFYC